MDPPGAADRDVRLLDAFHDTYSDGTPVSRIEPLVAVIPPFPRLTSSNTGDIPWCPNVTVPTDDIDDLWA